MKILFYSTNSNFYSKGKIDFKMIPSCADLWNNLKNDFPEHEFVVVMQKPGMFLYDDSDDTLEENPSIENSSLKKSSIKNPSVKYIFIEENNSIQNKFNEKNNFTKNNEQNNLDDSTPESIAKKIILEKPDIAIAVTYWAQPFDWLSIKDSLVAEILRDAGIKTICHNLETTEICFDKYKTHCFLESNNFLCAKAVYVQHELFFAERCKNCVRENVYKEMIFAQIKKLNFPVVIKDTCGLSSFGMDVAQSFNEAKHILLSKKNNGDRLVEEFLTGDSYGLEVYGSDGDYTITSPLINSVNQFGLTSPKQNVKLGPVNNERFKIEELKREILRLSKLLRFSGIAQIDLLYSNQKWYIIEINSRISGMTQTMAASLGLSLYELILFSAGIYKAEFLKNDFVMNLKFPLLKKSDLKKLSQKDFVFAVNQIENKEAKQLREVGYAEVIFGKCKTLDEILNQLEELNRDFPDSMEKIFYDNAKKLAEIIK